MDPTPETSSEQPPTSGGRPWIGVDLDGTLARFEAWRGFNHIGKPLKPMVARIREWQEAGYVVKIFTARACLPEAIPAVQKWLKKHKLGDLEVTNRKDLDLVEIWDDRCVQVITNTGNPVRSPSVMSRPKAPLLEEAFPHEARPKLGQ